VQNRGEIARLTEERFNTRNAYGRLNQQSKSNTMNYQEYMQTNFVKSMTESLSPIIGKGMARWFFVKIYQELQAQGKDIEKAVNTMTYRAENGLIADMLFWSIGTAPFDGEDRLYWTLMERILEANFSDKVLS
jgi:hypothetical protein